MSKDTEGSVFTSSGDFLPQVCLRDYLAAKALPVLLENCFLEELHDCDPGGWMDGIAYDAYRMADAMLRAREEK